MSHRSWVRAPQGVHPVPPEAQAGSAPLLPSSGPARVARAEELSPCGYGSGLMSHRSWVQAPKGVQSVALQNQAASVPLLPSSGPASVAREEELNPCASLHPVS